MKQNILRRAAALLLSLSLAVSLALPVWAASPGGGGTPTDPEYDIALSADGVTGNKAEMTLEDGKDVIMNVTATVTKKGVAGGGATPDSVTVKWSVSGDAVKLNLSDANGPTDKTITSVGIPTPVAVAAVKEGSATITASIDGQPDQKATFDITVKPAQTAVSKPVTAIAISPANPTVGAGKTVQLSIVYTPDDADTGDDVEWSVAGDDTALASVDDKGLVTGKSAGTATIIATSKANPKITASCEVKVTAAPPPGLTGLSIRGGSSSDKHVFVKDAPPRVLYAVAVPADAALPDKLVWTSSDEKVVTVEAGTGGDVTVTPVGPGVAYLTVSTEDGSVKSSQYEVTVSGVVITSDPGTIQLGRTVTMTCQRYGAAATTGVPAWASDRPTIIGVSGSRITARAIGTAKITASSGIYTSAPVEVKVEESTENIITGSITNAQTYPFSSIANQLNSISRVMVESGLDYLINLQVPTGQGTLYYNYVSSADHNHGVGSTEIYYLNPGVSQWGLRDVAFVPAPGFTGTAEITYQGVSTQGDSYSGVIRLQVSSSGDVSYSTPVNTPVAFEAADFNSVCRERTGRDLSHVTFTLPDPARGTLYFNYMGAGQYSSLVSSTDRCYRNRSPYLESVSFVPAADFTGTVRISYRCVDTSDAYFTGYVTVNVTRHGVQEEGEVSYRALQGERVTFDAADFNSACLEALGETLDYVYFTALPDSADGTLYYYRTATGSSRTPVSSNTRCYRSSSSSTTSLSRVSFVPGVRDLDVVSIPFTAYGTGGSRFNGAVTIRYSGGDGEIVYSTRTGQARLFESADFNELCVDLTGENLYYIRFESLPTSYQGTLYYNYSSSYSSGSKVTSNTRLYRGSGYSASLSRVAFVPLASFSGSVSLDFTGYGEDGGRLFTGTVLIEVESVGDITVRYTAYSGRALSFAASDFDAACQTATGSRLDYVQFKLPPSSAGTLYYDYDASKTRNTSVSASTSYYRTGSSRLLGNVSFLPKADYTGTLELTYTGVAANGERYTGTVRITVSSPAAQTVRYSTNSLPMTFAAYSFSQAVNGVLPRELSYIQFTSLPTSSQGTLYHGYTAPGTGSRASIGTRYYYSGSPGIGQLCFVPAAGFQGQVTLYYSAYDAGGERVSGTVVITVASQTVSGTFRDMSAHTWAIPAVDFLSHGGVVSGVGDGQFGPGQSVKRGDFVLMLCKAMQFNTGGTSSFRDVPSGSYYAWAIATAQNMGLASGSNGRFMPENVLTRQDAMVIIQKALQAAGKSVPSASEWVLSGYTDSGQISDYAWGAMASMIQLGVISGYGNGQVRPLNPINRAEVAVILHKILTQ